MRILTKLAGVAASLALGILLSTAPQAQAKGIVWDGSEPAPGVWFYWYEPSFYAGFAPKTQDKTRVHIQLSRGNQSRFTIVLGDAEVDNYLDDLVLRRDLVNELVEKEIITLSTNMAFERYVSKLEEAGVDALLSQRDGMPEADFREKSIEMMEALNPDRIFRIRMPLDQVLETWRGRLQGADLADKTARHDAVNALLPGRINSHTPSDAAYAALDAAAADLDAGGDAFRDAALALLEATTEGRYGVKDGHVTALEFTTIHPVGTAQSWTNSKYGKLPAYGVQGVWPLISRDKAPRMGGMVDYLSTNPGYGFIPLVGYEYAGGIAYNAFHNAGIRTPAGTRYLPKEWRSVPGERDPDKPYAQLWLVSRGPASHGCTRMDSGQMSEFRNSMPSRSEDMAGINNFRGLPVCHEVFDINGDGTEEVMGVSYFHGYSSSKHKPGKAYAPNNRKDYYDWLYRDNVRYEDDGSAVIKKAPICRFTGLKKASEMAVLEDVPLYEAPFESSPIQFYQLSPTAFDTRPGFKFNRELRRVGVGYETDREALFLDR